MYGKEACRVIFSEQQFRPLSWLEWLYAQQASAQSKALEPPMVISIARQEPIADSGEPRTGKCFANDSQNVATTDIFRKETSVSIDCSNKRVLL
jgi:hypothetical protein